MLQYGRYCNNFQEEFPFLNEFLVQIKYCNIVHIEALTALDMARKEIAPAVIDYQVFLMNACKLKKEQGIPKSLENNLLLRLANLSEEFSVAINKLEEDIAGYNGDQSNLEKAKYCKEVLLSDMDALRNCADAMEMLIGKDFYAFPSYEDILYSVKY